MPEIRFEAGDQDVAVLDGYCSARGKCRTEVIKQILARGIVAAFYDFKVAHERMTRLGINGKDRE